MTSKITRSKTWFRRRFRLGQITLHWGRFSVEDPQYAELDEDAKNLARLRFQQANPQLIADAFQHLLCIQKPEALSSFYSEMHVLAAYEFSKEALASASNDDPDAYSVALNSMSSAFNAALTAVLQSARAIREESPEFVEYSPTLATPYAAVFRTQGADYDAVFDSELVLKSVHQRTQARRIWPPLKVSRTQSALLASLS